jgi:hypothetical protein
MKRAVLFLIGIILFCAAPAFAQTTATYGESQVGVTNCVPNNNSADFDTIAQCNASSGTGTFQKAPLFVGAVTSPPYAATTCGSTKAGMIQWTGSLLQVCDGSSWINLGGASVCTGPSSLSFTNQSGVAVNSTITSNAVTMSGFSCTASAVCSGCIIVKNNVAVGTSTTTVAGDTIAIRVTSSPFYSTMVTAILYIGTTNSGIWIVTTAADSSCGGTPAVGTVCADGTIYAGATPDGNVKMYTTPCDVGMSGTQGACTGTRATKKWSYGGSAYVGTTSSVVGQSNTLTEYLANGNADGPYEAATYCKTLNLYGHTDWYLPALAELNTLYAGYSAIGGFLTDGTWYWSSTEYPYAPDRALNQRFSDGTQGNTTNKANAVLVRCTRKEVPADACPGAANPGDLCPDGTVYAGLSPDTTVKMYAMPCDLGMSGTQNSCTGGRTGYTWNDGSANWTTPGVSNGTTGKANTLKLVALGTTPSPAPYNAAWACYNQTFGGHSDWYLPATSEMGVLYNNKTAIGSFDNYYVGWYYWSSTEYGGSYAYALRFADGSWISNPDGSKNSGRAVRCVRR